MSIHTIDLFWVKIVIHFTVFSASVLYFIYNYKVLFIESTDLSQLHIF